MTPFSEAEIAALQERGFTIETGMATITSGAITVAVLSGRVGGGFFQVIVKLPNGAEILCRASPIDAMGID